MFENVFKLFSRYLNFNISWGSEFQGGAVDQPKSLTIT